MCYFKLTTSNNESLNSHCRNINLYDELHFQYWQDVKISQPSTMHMQVDLQTTGFYTLSNTILQLCVNSEIKVCTQSNKYCCQYFCLCVKKNKLPLDFNGNTVKIRSTQDLVITVYRFRHSYNFTCRKLSYTLRQLLVHLKMFTF